jgi:hypothetical protein
LKSKLSHATWIVLSALSLLSLQLSGCGAPTPDASTELGKRQIIDQANKALTTSDCSTALELLLPVYNSANSDNEIRMMTASAYDCWANINFFKLVGDMVTHGTTLAGSGFWSYASSIFPSTLGKDHVAEGSLLGQDALLATINPGIPILPSGAINLGSYNVGSVYPADRTDDSNLELIFTAMAGIGSLQNRYGNPNASFLPQANPPLPWTTAATVSTDGCGYASSVLNFVDGLTQSQNNVPSSVKTAIGYILNGPSGSPVTLQQILDAACDFGCMGIKPTVDANHSAAVVLALDPGGNWALTGCNFASGCNTAHQCPSTLRNRSSCTAQATDVNSCAAAGITNFINKSPLGWQ